MGGCRSGSSGEAILSVALLAILPLSSLRPMIVRSFHNTTALGKAMGVLALVVALLSVPAFGADYTPWPSQEREPVASKWGELAQQTQKCCKRCSKGQPCGDSCIAAIANPCSKKVR
jgi:hypothetical protein